MTLLGTYEKMMTDEQFKKYHSVPVNWSAEMLINEHHRLKGTTTLFLPETTDPVPSWLPDRKRWLMYRDLLHQIANGIKKGDPACIELAIRYIEFDFIGSYSGYLKSLLSRQLKHAAISESQRRRLVKAITGLLMRGVRRMEMSDYVRLLNVLTSDSEKTQLLKDLASKRSNEGADWLKKHFPTKQLRGPC